jgi:mercuric ion transport protein
MDPQKSSKTGTNWSLGAALRAALAASACCTIPLALVSLGIGGAWIGGLTALEPYRWLFVLFAAGALGYAGYNEWQMSRRPDCDCETIFSSTTRRTLLGAGTLAVVTLVASPWLIASSPSEAKHQARTAATTTEQPEASTPRPSGRLC